MAQDRSNVKAGLFVLVGITLAFIVIVLLSDMENWFTKQQQVGVRYALSDGVGGLKEGATVGLGHYPVGTVLSITDDPPDAERVTGKVVTFVIPARYVLFDNAQIELVIPTLGSGTSLNIRSVGRAPEGNPAEDEAGNPRLGDSWTYVEGDPPIPGGIQPSAMVRDMVAELGIGDTQRQQLRNIIANVNKIMDELGKEPGRYGEIIDSVKSAAARADDALAKVNDLLDTNSPVVTDGLARLRNASEDIEAVTHRVREETMQTISEALDKADAAVDELKAMIVTQRPVLERMIANMRLTADQLKLAAIEIRRSPWRLLYKPTGKELETDNLYDAARSFALAAGTLQSTADSMQAMLDRYGEQIDTEDPNFKLLLDDLYQTFERFNEAEQQFWDALNQQR